MSTERIKDRMIKTAAKLWKIEESEIDKLYDPLFIQLVEACAVGLEKIEFDLKLSEDRLVNQMIDTLIPEAYLNASPASCVLQSFPDTAFTTVSEFSHFSISKEMSSPGTQRKDIREVFFTPIGHFNLYDIELAYTVIGNRVIASDSRHARSRTIVSGHSDHRDQDKISEIWFVLRPGTQLHAVDQLSLYFEISNKDKPEQFYTALASATCTINGEPAVFHQDYGKNNFEDYTDELLATGQDHSRKVKNKAAALYKSQFKSITAAIPTGGIPQELASVLPEDIYAGLNDGKSICLKITLPRYFNAGYLYGVSCFVNAFPAINRKLGELNDQKPENWVNIIPLNVKGHLLNLHDITSNKGNEYRQIANSSNPVLNEGEAYLRTSGMDKTSSFEVRELIGILISTIRDESAYFSEINNISLSNGLKEISHILSRMQDEIYAAKDNIPAQSYVLLKPAAQKDSVNISFWSTIAEEANVIVAGDVLNSVSSKTGLLKKTTVLTNATGGKGNVSAREKKNIFIQQIASDNRIVSAYDIKLCCQQVFSEKMKEAHIRKGVEISEDPDCGYIRTIEIVISINAGYKGDEYTQELQLAKRELDYILTHKMISQYPFRIILA